MIALYLLVAIFNHGFIAVDDYSSNIEVIVPARNHTFQGIIHESDFRPAFVNVLLASITKSAELMGVVHPKNQLIVLRVLIGLLALLLFWLSMQKVFDKDQDRSIGMFMITCYFLSPLIFTRPLIEGLSAPWLLLSAAFGVQLIQDGRSRTLALSITALAIAAMIRYQSGICILGLIGVVLLQKRLDLTLELLGFSLLAFGIIGGGDWIMKGQFHASLISYINYNRIHSMDYGVTPFYSYFGLFLLLSLFPLWLGRYRNFSWFHQYENLTPLFYYFLVFLGVHSFVGHKEERFMIPILPIFLCLFVPLMSYWIRCRARKRLILLASLNFILLLASSYHMPQQNVIGVAKYVDEHSRIRRLIGFSDTLAVYPRVMVNRPVEEFRIDNLNRKFECDSVIALRKGMVEVPESVNLEKIAEYSPGLPERILVKLNPLRNARRGGIELWRPRNCPGLS